MKSSKALHGSGQMVAGEDSEIAREDFRIDAEKHATTVQGIRNGTPSLIPILERGFNTEI